MSKHRRASQRRVGSLLVGSALGAVTLLPTTMFAGTAAAAEVPQVCQELDEAATRADEADKAYNAKLREVSRLEAEVDRLKAQTPVDPPAVARAEASLEEARDQRGNLLNASVSANRALSQATTAAAGEDCDGGGGNEEPPGGGNEEPPGGNEEPPGGGNEEPPGGNEEPPGGNEEPPGGNEEPPGGNEEPPGGNGPGSEEGEPGPVSSGPEGTGWGSGGSVVPIESSGAPEQVAGATLADLGSQVSEVPVGSVDAGDGSTSGLHIGQALVGLGGLGLVGTGAAGAVAYRRRQLV